MATEPDQVRSGAIATLIAVLTFGVFASALAMTALVRDEQSATESDRADRRAQFAALRGAQEAELHAPASIADAKQGLARLPIEQSMSLMARALRQNPWAATWPKPEPEEPEAAEEAEGDSEGTDGEEKAADEPAVEGQATPTGGRTGHLEPLGVVPRSPAPAKARAQGPKTVSGAPPTAPAKAPVAPPTAPKPLPKAPAPQPVPKAPTPQPVAPKSVAPQPTPQPSPEAPPAQ